MLTRALAATVLLAVLLGGCSPTPSRSPLDASPSVESSTPSTSEASPLPSPTLLATPVPGSMPRSLSLFFGKLSPLPAEMLPLVHVTADDASRTVLRHERETGWPDPDIAYRDGGCVFLAWYEPRPMSYAPDPGPPSAVYLVRLVQEASPSRDIWVSVNATTGELGAAFGTPLSSECDALAS